MPIVRNKILNYMLGAILLLPNIAHAVDGTASHAYSSISRFDKNLHDAMQRILASEMMTLTIVFFTVFAIIRIIKVGKDYSMGQSSFNDFTDTFLAIMFTHLIIQNFDMLTGAVWGATEYVGQTVQEAMVGSRTHHNIGSHLETMVNSMSTRSVTVMDSVKAWFFKIVVEGILFIFRLLILSISMWATYGYALAKFIGLIFIPFLILDNTRTYFMRWASLFLHFCFFNMLLHVTMSLTLIVVASFFAFDVRAIPSSIQQYNLDVEDVGSFIGLISYLVLSIYGVIQTANFSNLLAETRLKDTARGTLGAMTSAGGAVISGGTSLVVKGVSKLRG